MGPKKKTGKKASGGKKKDKDGEEGGAGGSGDEPVSELDKYYYLTQIEVRNHIIIIIYFY